MNKNKWIIKILEDALEKAKKGYVQFESMDTRVVGVQIGELTREPTLLEVTLRYYEVIKHES